MLQARERTPILCPSIVFTFGFVVESIQEFGGVSQSDKGHQVARKGIPTLG
jgi:hypothetical protein